MIVEFTQRLTVPAPARVLVADPGWKFDDKCPGDGIRGAEKKYTVMDAREIARMALPPIDENGAILFLWRVASMQQEALDVVRFWGFTLKTEIVWKKLTKTGKTAIGMGHYTRGAHETCLVATRGRFHVKDKSIRSIFETLEIEAEIGDHSEKPGAFFALVDLLTGTDGTRVELFARRARPGWHCFGNELPGGYAYTPLPVGLGVAEQPPVTYATPAGNLTTEEIATKANAGEMPGMGTGGNYRAVNERTVESVDRPNGTLPPHVVKDLGVHPAIVDLPLRSLFVAIARNEGVIPSGPSMEEDWIRLQYAAPAGWFRDKRAAAEALVAGTKPIPCAACDRGVPKDGESAYQHACNGHVCAATSAAPAAIEQEARVERRAIRCGKCGGAGHNARGCTAVKSPEEDKATVAERTPNAREIARARAAQAVAEELGEDFA